MKPPTSGGADPTKVWDAIGLTKQRAPAPRHSGTVVSAPGRICTATGRLVDPLHLHPDDISIHDIAQSLSQSARYLGHAPVFYSVAQHAVIVASMVPPSYRALALHHDDSEAYLHDMPAPLKALPEFQFYRDAEERATRAIAFHFNLADTVPDIVWAADRYALFLEGQYVFPTCGEVARWPKDDADMPNFIRLAIETGDLHRPPRAWFDSWSAEMARAMYLDVHEWVFGVSVDVEDGWLK